MSGVCFQSTVETCLSFALSLDLQQPACVVEGTSEFYIHFFILQVRSLRSGEAKLLPQGAQLVGTEAGQLGRCFPAFVKCVVSSALIRSGF